MYSWVKHFANVSCCVNILIIVINAVRKYFDRQQSRWTFPSHGVFYRGIRICRDSLYVHTEKADGVLASWNSIYKAAVFFFVPCTFAIPGEPRQAKACSPVSPWLQGGAKAKAVWMFTGKTPASQAACGWPGPAAPLPLQKPGGWPLELPLLCPASLPSAWMLTAGLLPPACSHGKRSIVLVFASTNILRKARAFLGGVLFLVRKLEALKMSAPNFSALDLIGISFSSPFLFLGQGRLW